MNKRLNSVANIPFAPVVAAMFAAITAILILMTPPWLFERLIVASGLPELVPAAHPPLGETALTLCAIAGGFGVLTLLWAMLWLVGRFVKRNDRPKTRGRRIDPAAPAPPAVSPTAAGTSRRAPIFAERELGAPFMSDEAIASVPTILPQHDSDAPRSVGPADDVASAPPALDTPAPRAAVVATQTATQPPQTIGDALTRLESALERRTKRGLSSKPLSTGDIASLRGTVRGLF